MKFIEYPRNKHYKLSRCRVVTIEFRASWFHGTFTRDALPQHFIDYIHAMMSRQHSYHIISMLFTSSYPFGFDECVTHHFRRTSSHIITLISGIPMNVVEWWKCERKTTKKPEKSNNIRHNRGRNRPETWYDVIEPHNEMEYVRVFRISHFQRFIKNSYRQKTMQTRHGNQSNITDFESAKLKWIIHHMFSDGIFEYLR